MKPFNESRPGTTIALRRGLLGVALLWLSAVGLLAQAGTSGSISGRVRNVGNDRFLNNARVVIEGSGRETFTNEFGEYRFDDVPAGEQRIRAGYTGLDSEAAVVSVTAGQVARRDFNLTSRERYGEDKTVVLSEFVVQSNREYEGNALALNEQRYSPNVKVVVSADAFGDISEGNPGEFLKYLPGLSVDYVAADVRTVSVRGFASNFTNVSWDGMRLTSSASGSNNRIFEFEQVSINNTSRTEVTKVPTPDTPADSLGGSINFISKNAFERKGAQFNYRAYLNMNSENTKLFSKTPGPGNKETYKILPNFDFDYTLPVNDRFGLVITGLTSNQHVEQHRWQTTWNFAQAGATPTNPYLQQWQLQDGPKTTNRASLGIKADYKLTDTQTFSIAAQNNYYKTFFGNRNINFNIGTTATPTPSTGTPLSWGPDFVQAATGRASVTRGSSFRDKLGNTAALNLRYNWRSGVWNVDAGANTAVSRTWYRSLSRGHFSNVGQTLQNVAIVRAERIAFPDMDWSVRDASGAAIDPYSLTGYRLLTATNDPLDGKANVRSAYADVTRQIDAFSFPLAVKTGINVREEGRDNRRISETYTYLGPDGVANTADDGAAPFIDKLYSGTAPYFNEPSMQWIDPYLLGAHYAANPAQWRLGTGTNQTGVEAETNRRTNSENITETVTAGYVQFDAKLMNNRLRVVTGVRYEHTSDQGEGLLTNPDAVFQRNADGSYVDSNPTLAGIQRVRRTDAGTAGSLQELNLTRVERGYKASREYDGFYPSLHFTYEFTNNFLARFAYASTIGRPDYSNIIPNADINEDDNDPNAPGVITIRNTALRPWTADNFDLSLEYYFDKGGMISGGAFMKKLSDFWGQRGGTLSPELAEELGLESRYVGWTVSTQVNGGDAEITGTEFNLVRPLQFLPGWGRHLTLKANGTALHLAGDNTPDFRGFISRTGNVSLSFNRAPVVLNVNLNYRGRQKGTSITSPAAQTGAQYGTTTGFFEYFAPRVNLDFSGEYKLSKRYNIFFAARNVLNKEQVIERYSIASPSYASGYRHEEFGVNFSLGIKGRF